MLNRNAGPKLILLSLFIILKTTDLQVKCDAPRSAKHCRVFYSLKFQGLEADCSALGLVEPPSAEQVPENLVALDLSNNLIETLNERQIKSFSGLKSLDLSDNLLTKMPQSVLRILKQLEVLKLSQNQLTKWSILQSGTLTKLTELDLSNNEINELSENQFVNLPRLRILNLSRMPNLDEVHESSFGKISSKIEMIDLRHSGLKRLEFLRALPTGEETSIYLNHNSFVCDCQFLQSLRLLRSKRKNIVDYDQLQCASPGSMSDKLISTIGSDTLKCRPGSGQILMVDLSPKQLRAKCAFRDAETIHWYLDDSSIDPLANNITNEFFETNSRGLSSNLILISTLTLDIENLDVRKLSNSAQKNDVKSNSQASDPVSSFVGSNRTLECRANNPYGISRRFISLEHGAKHFADPWDSDPNTEYNNRLAYQSMIAQNIVEKKCRTTKMVLATIIIILLIVLLVIIPIALFTRRHHQTKVVHFNRDNSFGDSIRRSMRILRDSKHPDSAADQANSQQPVGVSPTRSSLARAPTSLVNIGRVSDFHTRSARDHQQNNQA